MSASWAAWAGGVRQPGSLEKAGVWQGKKIRMRVHRVTGEREKRPAPRFPDSRTASISVCDDAWSEGGLSS